MLMADQIDTWAAGDSNNPEGLSDLDGLALVRNQNDVQTAELFWSALHNGRAVGVIDDEQLKHLQNFQEVSISDRFAHIPIPKIPGPRIACFTSGSSGEPKAIIRTYESWVRSFELLQTRLRYDQAASTLILGNLAHSMHLFAATEAISRGAELTILKKFSVKRAIEEIRIKGIGLIHAVPAHINLILAYGAMADISPLPSVSHILVGGAKFRESHLAQLSQMFPNANIVEFFGTTETSFITIKDTGASNDSVGQPCDGVSLRIWDQDTQEVPTGTHGTIWVKSDMLFEDYVIGSDPNTKWQDGFLTVGDQGYLDNNGYLHFIARKGSMVTIAGENVFTDHIEREIQKAFPTCEFAVVPIQDAIRGTHLVVASQTSLSDQDVDRLLKLLRAQFGPLKAPRRVFHITKWPTLPSGKIDRQELETLIVGRK